MSVANVQAFVRDFQLMTRNPANSRGTRNSLFGALYSMARLLLPLRQSTHGVVAVISTLREQMKVLEIETTGYKDRMSAERRKRLALLLLTAVQWCEGAQSKINAVSNAAPS